MVTPAHRFDIQPTAPRAQGCAETTSLAQKVGPPQGCPALHCSWKGLSIPTPMPPVVQHGTWAFLVGASGEGLRPSQGLAGVRQAPRQEVRGLPVNLGLSFPSGRNQWALGEEGM